MINHYNYNNNNYYGLKTLDEKSEILELPGNGEKRTNCTL